MCLGFGVLCLIPWSVSNYVVSSPLKERLEFGMKWSVECVQDCNLTPSRTFV